MISFLLALVASVQEPESDLRARLDSARPAAEVAAELQRDAWLQHGQADDALAMLRALAGDEADAAARGRAFEILAEFQFREGLLADAASSAVQACREEPTVPRLWLHARLLDALDRSEAAAQAYARLREAAADPAWSALVDRRTALIEAIRRPAPGGEDAGDGESRLYGLAAADGTDDAARSRAAIVLAMLGRPGEALRLYPALGEGTARFRREIRLAEWALAAGEAVAAQQHAWQARVHAATKRDRRYALALLAESHRADDSLDALLDRYAAEPELDEDSRLARMDLLRESGRVDEALALFAGAGEQGFSAEMRRQLLDLCREAGREEELVAAYRELIAAEPRSLEWREGLARHWLGRGRREEARAVWDDLIGPEAANTMLLQVAEAASALGLDELARSCSGRVVGHGEDGLLARLYLFSLELQRGRVEAAQEELAAFDREADARSPARVDLADAYERIGLQARAVEILEGLRAARGGDLAEEDLEMRLAWLLAETGDEERALELWRSLWRSVQSVARRGQVEDRMLATAARLGTIADLAVELEEKLADGRADDRDASLLVRLYQKVGDPVSAAEILEEHLKRLGDDPVRTLEEKARVYLAGKDFYHFERAVERLIELDPDNRSDRRRQLAMSMMERGKPQEARAVLRELALEESPSDAAEFEAGVLALAKLDDEAILVYRKGLAAHPERIDSYLLLAEAMRRTGAAERAAGMFQHLIETADKDDLFTVAVDGVLNMRARAPVLRWTLRAILERLAARDDRTYLFQLAADLGEELEDNELRMRALEASLPIANEQRASILRELMDLSLGRSLNVYTVVNGRLVPQRSGGDEARRLAYGRRLIALGDVVPPDVYLELGGAFLRAGEPANAAKTFDLARDLPDWQAFRRRVAAAFEAERYVGHALGIYDELLASAGADAGLLLKAGELNEELGDDERATGLYRAGLELLLDRLPLAGEAERPREEADAARGWMPRNVDERDTHYPVLESGFLAAASEAAVRDFLAAQRRALVAELEDLGRYEPPPADLAACRRPAERAALSRRLALAMGWLAPAAEIDLLLLAAFPEDRVLLGDACRDRLALGYVTAARRLAADSGRPEPEQEEALAGAAREGSAAARGPLLPEDAVRALLPLLVAGDQAGAVDLLRRTDLRTGDRSQLPALQQLLSAALFLEDPYVAVQLAQAALRLMAARESNYGDSNAAKAVLERLRGGLDAESFDLVFEGYLTELLGEGKEDVFQVHLNALVVWRTRLGRNLVDIELLRERIEDILPDRSYWLTQLLELVGPDQRLALLQPIWSQVPPTRRSSIALNLLAAGQEPLPDDYAEFLSGACLDALGDLENVNLLAYPIEQLLLRGGEAVYWLEPIVERMLELEREDPQRLAQAAATRIARGRMGAALEAMNGAVVALAADASEDYRLHSARRVLIDAFVPENADRLLAAVSAAEDAGGDAERLGVLRAEVFRRLGDHAAEFTAAEAAHRAAPEDRAKAIVYYRALEGRGLVPESMALLQRLAADDPADAEWTKRYAQRLRALGDFARSLAASEAAAEPDGPAEDAERLPPADLARVREAAEAGHEAEARDLYRRTWRVYGQADDAFSAYSGFAYFSGRQSAIWPVAQDPVDEAKAETPTGLAAWRADRDPLREEPEPPLRSFAEGLAEYDFGRAELRRQWRRLARPDVGASASLLRGLQAAAVREQGEAAARAAWLAGIAAGEDGVRERALYLAFLEQRPEGLSEPDRSAFETLAAAVSPRDVAALRSVARVHASLGDADRAERVYHWLASLATAAGWIPDGRAAVSTSELVAEVARVLDGDARLRALRSILQRSDPGGAPWEREQFLRLSMEAWLRYGGAEAAESECQAAIEAVLGLRNGLLRRPAILAARILAERGRRAEALRALEIALCGFAAHEVEFDPRERYSAADRLRPASVGLQELLIVFPGGAESAHDGAWLAAAAEATMEWNSYGRLQESTAQNLLLLLCLRLREAGDIERSQRALAEFAALGEASAFLRLVATDLTRLLGDEARAMAEERALLAECALPAPRIPATLRALAEESGAAAALALGEQAGAWLRHRELIETLVALAEETGAAEAAARWRAEIAAQERAAAELEAEW